MEKLKRLHPDENGYSFTFSAELLAELKASYHAVLQDFLTNPANRIYLEGGSFHSQEVGDAAEYFMVSYGNFPLLWLSCNKAQTLALFQRFFEGLGITDDLKQLVDHDEKIVMYGGFFVIGDRAPYSLWHDDYFEGANAYTLITPLFEPIPGHGRLLYKAGPKELVQIYPYRLGEAILVGEGFVHATEPYAPSKQLRVLVSLTMGTDKLEHWKVLKQSVTSQSKYFNRPCGHPVGSCECLLEYMKRLRG